MGDPTRLAIVERLSAGPAAVSELAAPFDMSLRGVLKHIEVLERAGLVRSSKNGRERRCALDRDALVEVHRWIEQVTSRWTRRLDRMERLLASEGARR